MTTTFCNSTMLRVTLLTAALLVPAACRPAGTPAAPEAPADLGANDQSVAPPQQVETAEPEPLWTGKDVLAFLFATEREIYVALPYPKYSKELPFVGQCFGDEVRGYWKAADVLPVFDKRMTPRMRACRLVDIGCVIGPWIGRYSWGAVYLPYVGSKATITEASLKKAVSTVARAALVGSKATIVEASRDRVVADVEEGDNDDVTNGGKLNTSVIGSGWEPTVSRYVFERGADGLWRITDKTNLWNDGDCDPGPTILYPTPHR